MTLESLLQTLFSVEAEVQPGASLERWLDTGAVHGWQVVGPFPADTMAASPLVNTAPDAWNLDGRVKVGDLEFPWRSITNTARLELRDPVSGARESGVGLMGAYALCGVEADAELWAEITVVSGAPGGMFEVQFYLDGRELWDLRLGRETWSPKRLPLRINLGRHFLLVAARDRRTVPDVSISIRELGLPSGGRIRPVAPKTLK